MKKPTLNEWIAIAFAIISLIASICTALSDGAVTADEAAQIKAEGAKVINTVSDAIKE